MSLLGEADRPQHPRSGQLDGNKAPGRAPRRPKGLVETEVPTEGSVNLLPTCVQEDYASQQAAANQPGPSREAKQTGNALTLPSRAARLRGHTSQASASNGNLPARSRLRAAATADSPDRPSFSPLRQLASQ